MYLYAFSDVMYVYMCVCALLLTEVVVHAVYSVEPVLSFRNFPAGQDKQLLDPSGAKPF